MTQIYNQYTSYMLHIAMGLPTVSMEEIRIGIGRILEIGRDLAMFGDGSQR